MAGFSLKTNIASLQAQRQLGKAGSALSSAFERLSSGQRINRASDDAAGLAIATSLNSNARVYGQAIRNANDGISLLSIAQDALQALSTLTTRQYELAEQAANGTLTLTQRTALNREAQALADEFNRIVQVTQFNGRNVLDVEQSTGELRIQLGYGMNGGINVGIGTEFARTVGDGTFKSAVSYTTYLQGNRRIYSVDVNSDGKLDIVSAQSGAGVQAYLSNGDGTFANPVGTGGLGFVGDLSFGDFNRDGKVDAVTSNGDVLRGQGNGAFTIVQSLGFNRSAIADVNGDGIQDILAVEGLSTVRTYIGSGTGTFTASVSTTAGGSGVSVAAGDVNGDGLMDFVSHSYAPYGAAITNVFIGGGNGTFALRTSFSPGGFGSGVSLDDFNNDGKLDIFTASRDFGAHVSLGNGDGTFSSPVSISMGGGSRQTGDFKIADVNSDGIKDILIGSALGNSAMIFQGNGDGTFKTPTEIAVSARVMGIAAGDFNGDGAVDLAVGEYTSPSGLKILIANSKETSSVAQVNILTQENARNSLATFQEQLDRISAELGIIGSHQSRLNFAVDNLYKSRENIIAAASRITDADVATEAANQVRAQILQQVAGLVLAQANQSPALVLRLLDGS